MNHPTDMIVELKGGGAENLSAMQGCIEENYGCKEPI
jgi:hypothetical protein